MRIALDYVAHGDALRARRTHAFCVYFFRAQIGSCTGLFFIAVTVALCCATAVTISVLIPFVVGSLAGAAIIVLAGVAVCML